MTDKKVFEQLQEGQKVTIFKCNDFGFPYTLQTKIEKVEYKDYAQYKSIPCIQHRPKRKRTSYVIKFTDNEKTLIFDGWVDINVDMWATSNTNSNGVTTRRSLQCFDNGYFDIAMKQAAQLNIKPIIHYNSQEDIIDKYTIKDQDTILDLEAIAEANNGEINERYFNRYGLTPRHIKETFQGKYKPVLNY